MLTDDWLSRQIRELSDAIARAFDANAAGNAVDADEALAQGWNGLLPNGRELVATLDAASALRLFGSQERALGAIALLIAEVELGRARGPAHESAVCATLSIALDLADAVRAAWPALRDDVTLARLDALAH